MLTEQRLEELLSGFPKVRVALVGDFFLDKYLDCDRTLSEVSLETGLEAFQVVRVRCYPGAAGTVANNLKALKVGTVYAVGFTGDDGEGYELRRGLQRIGVDLSHLEIRPDLMTPTYTKPMMKEPDGRWHELNRLDIKNRRPLPEDLQERIIARHPRTSTASSRRRRFRSSSRAELRCHHRQSPRSVVRTGSSEPRQSFLRRFKGADRRISQLHHQAQPI